MRLRDLPSVDELVRGVDDPLAVAAARTLLERAREEIRAGDEPGDLRERLAEELAAARRPALRRVLNATGVLIHTNLGRAPLAAGALDRIAEVSGYSNLEYDVTSGSRGSRQDHLAPLLRRLTGAEAAIVVNNNAAALLLALAALAEGREVVVSRGELIEIGDGFRIPDVLARSGARLVEVGTTNRTRAADYDRAIGPETALLLRVHQSNFRVVGFTEQPRVEELAAVARRHELHLVDDLGSGALVDVEGEPTPAASLAAGADLVCFSGDKLLGGPQAGIVAGRADLVEQLRRHPLHRALRSDKLTLAALEGTLALYLDRPDGIPVVRMLREPAEAVRVRAARLAEATGGTVEETVARVGGGALPLAELPSFACAVEEELAAALRTHEPPVVAVVRDGRTLLDCRTLTDAEAVEVAAAVRGMPLTVGTAGHIDHGKTWLVRALTGKDTDRLPEERDRGISIDLGYAPLDLPDGRRLSLIDVPGHERFVRNMVAGATGIDLFLLVVDAAEGARPQTYEHLAILSLLGIERGVLAVTKADAVDEETLELAVEEARQLVPQAEVVAVSAKTGAGLDELRAALSRAADLVADSNYRSQPAAPSGDTNLVADSNYLAGHARLYVDRVFSLRGIGTVVTGTLWSGTIGEGDVLRAEPGGREVRVRSVQVHEQPIEPAEAGQRVALALPGVERSELRRGDALVAPAAFTASYRLDVSLQELEPIPDGARLLVHHGTSAVLARVVRAGDAYAQLRLAKPVVAARGDRVVLRGATTVGGGVVLDAAPARHADPARFASAERGEAVIYSPTLVDAEWRFSDEWLAELRAGLEERIAAADPLDPGVTAPTEPWAKDVLARLPFERRGSKLYLPGAAPSLGERSAEAAALEAELEEAAPAAIKAQDAELARYLEREGKLVRLGDGYAISAAAYERARALVVEECETAGRIALARFRDLAGCGRRDAQLVLERLDADGVTRRVRDERLLRRRTSEPAT